MGPVEPRRAKPRDRVAAMASVERIRFTSAILPRRCQCRLHPPQIGRLKIPQFGAAAHL